MENIVMCLLAIYVIGSLIHCYTDFKDHILYDEVSLLMLMAGVVFTSITAAFKDSVVGALLAGLVFFLMFGFCQGGMGFGDVKFAIVLGAWLGWQKGLLGLLLALCLGTVVGIILLLWGIKKREDAIPFGPYMCLSGAAMLCYGEELLAWYVSLF